MIQSACAQEKASLISEKDLEASGFPRLFREREFKRALESIDRLIRKYPDDPLLLRYRALTLDKLGRHKEAVAAYRQLLAQQPNHVPTHLFLGLAYARDGKPAEATRELQWVMEHSDSDDYRHWAQGQLSRIRKKRRHVAHLVHRKPYLFGKVGAAYDSNPLLTPDDGTLSSEPHRAGADYILDLTTGYPFILEKNTRVDALYINETLLHDRGTDDVNFTSQGVAVDAKRRTFIDRRPVLWGARYDFRANFLRSDLFSVVNQLLLSADTIFWRHTRTDLYGRASYANYGPDGSNPPVTSRDGVRGGIGVIQYFYPTRDYKSYVFLKEEWNAADTRGDNFDREGSLTRIGLHAPLRCLGPVDPDLSVGFDYGVYPEFSSLSTLDQSERPPSQIPPASIRETSPSTRPWAA
ncbi:MAG: tetratricopeptide repeat protein [Candidatus Omnitrophica bacterium]|nr:tetratricopeptide repeat protein [Candidatus Omnitrophota bacterium]